MKIRKDVPSPTLGSPAPGTNAPQTAETAETGKTGATTAPTTGPANTAGRSTYESIAPKAVRATIDGSARATAAVAGGARRGALAGARLMEGGFIERIKKGVAGGLIGAVLVGSVGAAFAPSPARADGLAAPATASAPASAGQTEGRGSPLATQIQQKAAPYLPGLHIVTSSVEKDALAAPAPRSSGASYSFTLKGDQIWGVKVGMAGEPFKFDAVESTTGLLVYGGGVLAQDADGGVWVHGFTRGLWAKLPAEAKQLAATQDRLFVVTRDGELLVHEGELLADLKYVTLFTGHAFAFDVFHKVDVGAVDSLKASNGQVMITLKDGSEISYATLAPTRD